MNDSTNGNSTQADRRASLASSSYPPLSEPLLNISTAFTEQFSLRFPIVSAPMFLVSNADMVVATAQAGGMGAVPALNFRPIENYQKALIDIRRHTQGAIAVNVIVQSSNKFQEQHIALAIENGVDLIVTSLGNPKRAIEMTRGTRTKVYCDVVGLEHAQKARDLGADGLIAVGSGAGGHGGTISLFALIPHLKQHISLPILAAGNIVDGATMLAALSLGADGVYMGTRFIASTEAQVRPEYKQAIIDATPDSIVNTDRVDGFPGNFIRTPELEKLGIHAGPVETLLTQNQKFKRYLSLYRAARVLFGSTESKASYKNMFSAGQGAGLIQDVAPIEEIIARIVREYHQAKLRLP